MSPAAQPDPVNLARGEVNRIKDAMRRHLEGVLERQVEHPVHPRVEVLWEVPYDVTQCTIRVGKVVERVAPEKVAQRVGNRNRLIENESKDPLRFACEPDIWRQIDLEMCRKRLENPGAVLELLVTGGIRSGKTEGATRRVNAHYFYTRDAWVWGLHETDTTSRMIQQKRVYRFLPPELDTSTGKHKRDKRTKFSYSEGTGFTGSSFNIYWECFDEEGRRMECGGAFEFRFYKQDTATLQGAELTCATSDELVPISVVSTVNERLATRATTDTARPEFLKRIRKAKALLEAGEPLPLPLLGALYHGVHIITFTPKEGWNSTINSFLTGAVKYGKVEGELLKGMPGVQDARVPRFAQPTAKTRLVAYLHTADNVMKPGYAAVRQLLSGKKESEIRITAYGDVDKSWKVCFTGYDEEKHVRDWKGAPREGTIYEVCDPAGVRPWVLMWIMADVAGRHWVLQEWPSPEWEIEHEGFPGPWAVPSEHEKKNGDPGPAYHLRLNWSRARYTRLIWQGRQRLLTKLREGWEGVASAKPLTPEAGVRFENQTLEWSGEPGWKLEGEFAMPESSYMDSRFAGAKTENQDKDVVTMLEAMAEEENGVWFEPAPGDRLNEGDQLIQDALNKTVLGLPGLIVLRECENTRFMLSTYTLPEYSENTQRKDEVCKDFRDPIAYYLLKKPEHMAGVAMVSGPGRR